MLLNPLTSNNKRPPKFVKHCLKRLPPPDGAIVQDDIADFQDFFEVKRADSEVIYTVPTQEGSLPR